MKREQAIQKWCPFARAPFVEENGVGLAAAAINRLHPGQPDPACLCLAERCMAWRALSDSSGGWCGLVSG